MENLLLTQKQVFFILMAMNNLITLLQKHVSLKLRQYAKKHKFGFVGGPQLCTNRMQFCQALKLI